MDKIVKWYIRLFVVLFFAAVIIGIMQRLAEKGVYPR